MRDISAKVTVAIVTFITVLSVTVLPVGAVTSPTDNIPTDGNGDGIEDSTQANVTSVNNSVSGAYTTLEIGGDCSTINSFDVVAESSLAAQDSSLTYPLGFNDFDADCASNGATANIVVYFDQVYDTTNWDYVKFNGTTDTYTSILDQVTFGTATVSGSDVTTVSFSITDGGSLDEDGLANGTIVDPSGPGTSESGLVSTGISLIATAGVAAALIGAVIVLNKRKLNKRQIS